MSDIQKTLAEWSKQNAEKVRKHMAERKAVKGKDMAFGIEPYEQLTLSKWLQEHNKTCEKKKHNLLTYKFTPTGIGLAIIVECGCGEEVNITDYKMW